MSGLDEGSPESLNSVLLMMGNLSFLYIRTNTERGGKKEEYYALPSLTPLNPDERGKALRNDGFETILFGENIFNKYYLLEVW